MRCRKCFFLLVAIRKHKNDDQENELEGDSPHVENAVLAWVVLMERWVDRDHHKSSNEGGES